MLWTFFVTLLFVWGLGLAMSVTVYGFIHLLPLMALIVAVVGSFQHRFVV